MKRSRCAAGHKALWHEEFGGLPSNEFFTALDPILDGLRERMFSKTYTSDVSAGKLSAEWAERLGLPTNVEVAVGAFDATWVRLVPRQNRIFWLKLWAHPLVIFW